MLKNTSIILIVLFVVACSSSQQTQYNYSPNQFDITYVKANMEFLASDDLQGRNTATQSEKAAGQFIVSELKKYGVQPYADDGSYFQHIDFVSTKFGEESHVKIFDQSGNEVVSMKLGEDFMGSASASLNKNLLHKNYSISFAGYGITAEEFDYNDYSKIDVNNKIVIVMTGEPYSEDDSFFDGEKDTRYSNPFAKVDMAKEAGAIGVLIIPDEQYLQYWPWLKRRAARTSLSLAGDSDEKSIPAGLISIESTKKLFADQSITFERMEETISDNKTPEAFELNLVGRFEMDYVQEIKQGRNVVGIIPGNDPLLANEYVTIGAHYDHVGVNTEGEVFNGADDNASGTSSVMEVARLISQNPINKRSILFLFYTGEEKGLLGSEYFLESFSHKEKLLTNINIDMTGRESIDSIHVIGSERISTQFYEMIKEANAQSVNYFLDYSLSNTRLFRQSDHYTFAKENIPVVFFFDNMRTDLHRTTDDVEKINFKKIAKTAHLVSKLAINVANLDRRLALNDIKEN